ncbi:hypothetical protein H4F68_12010 [Rhodococcus globerulus]|nr:hypothetical protein [Rhodococcus globerulus]
MIYQRLVRVGLDEILDPLRVEQPQYKAVQDTLRESSWDKKAATIRLGLSRTTHYKRIRTFRYP